MKLPEENPPRRPGETALYEDGPFELGEVELEMVEDFLPSPEQLANAEQKIISRDSKNAPTDK